LVVTLSKKVVVRTAACVGGPGFKSQPGRKMLW